MLNQTVTVAAVQLNSQDNIAYNLATISQQVQQASSQGCKLVVLPENAFCFAAGKQQQTAEQFDAIKQQLAQLTTQTGIYLLAGTLPCPYRPNGQPVPNNRVRQTSLLFNPAGDCIARYDKIHLFDVTVADGVGQYCESATFEAGNQLVCAKTEMGNIGLMICYDLRFAEQAIALRKQGANILTAPAAFTYVTGKAHWQLLLQARALDSQCDIIGAAQTGTHGDRQTWGHSMIVNSWGEVVSNLDTTPHTAHTHTIETSHLVIGQVNIDNQRKIRENLPVYNHRFNI